VTTNTRRSEVFDLGARSGTASDDHTRRNEILQTAASLIASSGLRTSLQQIANAAGILPGSLYHHFESKDALLIELMQLYHADLERLAETVQVALDQAGSRSALDQIADLCASIADFAVQHRAQLQISFYEPPSSNNELVDLVRRRPVVIQQVMREALRVGRWSGDIRTDLDLTVLADRICQTMLHVGLDVMRGAADSDLVSRVLASIILRGLATTDPSDEDLDRSSAFIAADTIVRSWSDQQADPQKDKAAYVRAVARSEFGRRGYELTTVREIAAAADMATGTVHRLIGSKEELLQSIMRSFGEKIGVGWTAVLKSDATPLEKLDALSWLNVNALDQFSDEFRIQLAWMRQSPPGAANPGWSFATRLDQMQTMLSQGIDSGQLRPQSSSLEVVARCIVGIQWIPQNILTSVGKRTAMLHVRDTVLRGIAIRKDAPA
jgi:AcrR family transcriptional regulator